MKRILILFSILMITVFVISSCKKVTELVQYHVNSESCNACGECTKVCPQDAIDFTESNKAVIDQTKCIQCGDCILVCPEEAIQ